jgi:hypothetical protein
MKITLKTALQLLTDLLLINEPFPVHTHGKPLAFVIMAHLDGSFSSTVQLCFPQMYP